MDQFIKVGSILFPISNITYIEYKEEEGNIIVELNKCTEYANIMTINADTFFSENPNFSERNFT
jgi:hypothetical protein